MVPRTRPITCLAQRFVCRHCACLLTTQLLSMFEDTKPEDADVGADDAGAGAEADGWESASVSSDEDEYVCSYMCADGPGLSG